MGSDVLNVTMENISSLKGMVAISAVSVAIKLL